MNFSGIKVIEKGRHRREFMDFFHWVVTLRWWTFLLVSVGAYWFLNLLFAIFYVAAGNQFTNGHPGNWLEAVAFSFQTSSTIGYGYFAPTGTATLLLSMLEATVSLFFVALITGLFFARISRPRARVEFSRNILVTTLDGAPTLLFRVANGRSTHISNAQVKVSALVPHTSREGESMRRFIDLKLFRSESPIFAFTWSVLHTLDEPSPLRELARGPSQDRSLEIFISLTGFESALSQTVQAAHRYRFDDIVWNRNFQDIITVQEDGTRVIDYEKFHLLK
jgi:inward rectifier potassium channel